MRCFTIGLSVFVLYSVAQAESAAVRKLSFNQDIRPILTENCYSCHGPDVSHRKAKLRLDERAVAVDRNAIVPGKPEASSLIERIMSEDESEVMPTPESHKKLTAQENQLLRQWVKEGAAYEGHWAFARPERPALPSAAGVGHEIDAFVRQRLAKEGFSMSAMADPSTLLRRVTLDLTGLPPSVAEVEAFVRACEDGKSNAAYEAAVDRLLKSPAYGEQMSHYWLDYARYGDSHGYEKDSYRSMWMWRDWVIQAFNENKPFDKFTIEQLAGDLLPDATSDQIVATGFNRNHRINAEGGAIAEEWRIENVIDRVSTTGSTWLGLTLGCARCHDHKFDPVSQRDYYSFMALFHGIKPYTTPGTIVS
ncbi:MAG: DUF1549 domain-containing protein, partial [Roseimicrobium sp.]